MADFIRNYYYTRPIYVGSTKPFDLCDEDGKKIGEMQRYFKGKKQVLLNLIFIMK